MLKGSDLLLHKITDEHTWQYNTHTASFRVDLVCPDCGKEEVLSPFETIEALVYGGGGGGDRSFMLKSRQVGMSHLFAYDKKRRINYAQVARRARL